MAKKQRFQILHISDLHINAENNFDQSVVLDPLIERVKEDRCDPDLRPEIVVVTGDVAHQGIKEEYDLAASFFADLMERLELGNDKIFIVPGNHDLDRKAYPRAFAPKYDIMPDLNEDLGHPDYRNDLLKGHRHYFNFIRDHYPHMKSLYDDLVPFACSYKTECGKNIGLLGLNSAWMSRDSDSDQGRIAIGEFQIKKGLDTLNQSGPHDCRIGVFHHPLDFLWEKDIKICRSRLNDSILLSGHLHKARGGLTYDYDGKIHQFQAGAAYGGSEFPNRFQHVALDWDEGMIFLNFRKFDKEKHKWSLDADTGLDGKASFPMSQTTKTGSTKRAPTQKPTLPLTPPATYFEWINENHANMDADKLYGKGQSIPLSLPEIFVPLRAHDPVITSQRKIRARLDQKIRIDEKQGSVDVEELIVKNGFILMEGSAGSGKTTLLKHFTWRLAQKENWGNETADKRKNKSTPADGISMKTMDGVLPILIYLKDINDYFRDALDKNREATAEDIMDWYFRSKASSVIDIQTARRFIDAKKAAILLDGLDELLPKHRNKTVDAFADLRLKHPGVRVVVSGRPHSMEGAAIKRFGDRRVKVLPFEMDQIETYINKWFTYLYPGNMGIGARNAQAMIAEVQAHNAIAELSENPLMLTAICILYHDGKELPDQRAELYKKFIDNLLHRRFSESEKVHDYLKTLAYKMQMKRVRGVPRSVATETLKGIYKIRSEETPKEYQKRMEARFDDLEPKCGLLKLENGEYMFRHLTFQEFLAAHYIVNNSAADFAGAIETFWGDNWHNEVIELYIGYLSIENKEVANMIVEAAMTARDASPYKRWRLAAKSFQDIPESKRYENVLEKTQGRLIEIIDREPGHHNRAEAGETLGWLGDTRDLKAFVKIDGGVYDFEDTYGGSKTHEIKYFEIGKYPVVNSWFEEFVNDGGYGKKEVWSPEGWKWRNSQKVTKPDYWDDRKWRCPNSPVVGVFWHEAFTFAQWLTLSRGDGHTYRLLTEWEWQAAATGHQQRRYPWGDEWDKNRCNNKEIDIGKTTPVGIFKEGQTPEGVFDLSGNVLEWTDSWYDEDKDSKVLHGGSWLFGSDSCLCARRYIIHPFGRDFNVGFRCLRT